MKLIDFVFPIIQLKPENISAKIRQVYFNFDEKQYTAKQKRRTLLAGAGLLAMPAIAALGVLWANDFSTEYMLLYMLPLIVNISIFELIVCSNTTNKLSSLTVIIPQFALFFVVTGSVLLSEAINRHMPPHMIVYYLLLAVYMLVVLGFYWGCYKKFPAVLFRHDMAKHKRAFLIILLCVLAASLFSRMIPRAILGGGMLLFALYACPYAAMLLLLARYRPQIVKIGSDRGYV